WLLSAAMRSASALAAARTFSCAWYLASPCWSSCAHAWTCASAAAWARCVRAWLTTDGRSYALNWVTATLAFEWTGASNRGRTTPASKTVQTMTARNSGSKPLRSYLEVALPLGRCSGLSSERGRSGETAQVMGRSETLSDGRRLCVAVISLLQEV